MANARMLGKTNLNGINLIMIWVQFSIKFAKTRGGEKNIFTATGSINIKTLAFQDHVKNEEHNTSTWVI